jgi:hypothetical protein
MKPITIAILIALTTSIFAQKAIAQEKEKISLLTD